MSAPEPLTPHERALAPTLPVSLVRHEDRFGYFEDRDPAFVTAVVLTEDAARALVSRRPLPVRAGTDTNTPARTRSWSATTTDRLRLRLRAALRSRR